MALIPAGSFLMGGQSCIHWNATSGKAICDKYNPGEDYPPHTVTLDSFSIDIYEVTNAQYAECVAVGQCRPPDVEFRASKNANLPVTQVTWYDAQAYCTWRGARLPTEAEWEKAARGGLEAKWYPWGDDKPVCEPGAAYGAQSHDCWPNEVLAVGSFGSNGYGLYDTSGNVSEWVNDWYQNDYYTVSPGSNPQGPETGAMKVHRGGSYWDDADTWNIDNLGPAYRGTRDPGDAFFETGFRCALGP
jgi:formylglycine-generating enzyme required for sulfatase activity